MWSGPLHDRASRWPYLPPRRSGTREGWSPFPRSVQSQLVDNQSRCARGHRKIDPTTHTPRTAAGGSASGLFSEQEGSAKVYSSTTYGFTVEHCIPYLNRVENAGGAHIYTGRGYTRNSAKAKAYVTHHMLVGMLVQNFSQERCRRRATLGSRVPSR